MEPIDIIKTWVNYFNKADIDGLCSLYADDAVNHQVVTEPLVGLDSIRYMFEVEFSRADMTCQIENVFQDEEWAILEWSDPRGLRGCGFFQIKNDKIVFQRGYFDQLTFFKIQGLGIPDEYLGD